MEWQATVDRIEDGEAVLLPGGLAGMRVRLARALLPAEIRDGTVLRVRIDLDPAATDKARQDIARLQAELENEDR